MFPRVSSIFRSRTTLQLENLALRHQIGVLRRSARTRPKFDASASILCLWLSVCNRNYNPAMPAPIMASRLSTC
jgi:hypothetical protein